MKKRILLFFAAALCVGTSSAYNKTDSLKIALKKTKKTVDKINTFNLLGKEMFLAANYDSAVVYATQAKKLAEKNKNKKGIAAACNTLGNVYITRADYDKAFTLHSNALKLQLELKDKQSAADSYNNLGIVYYYKGDYPKALENYLSAFKIVKELNNKNGIARSHSNLGNIHFQQGNLDEALKNYEEALKIQQAINDKQGVGRTLNNLGGIYFSRGNFKKAMESFNASVKIKEEIGDVLSVGRSYINMGNIYFRLAYANDSVQKAHDSLFDLSLASFQKAIVALEKIGDKQAMASTYNNIGLLYVQKDNPAEARASITKAFALAKETGSKADIQSSYNAFAVVDSMTGNYGQSLANYKMFILYRDSLINDVNTKKTVEAEMNFAFGQKELKMKSNQEKKEAVYEEKLLRQKIQGWSVAGGITLVLLLVVLLINRVRLKQKHIYQQTLNRQQKDQAVAIMEAQEQERKRIAEDLHDSLGHLLSTVKMNLQTIPGFEKQHTPSMQLLNQASEELRNISFNLMPNVLEEEGLTSALTELAEKTGKSGKLAVSFETHDTQGISFDKPAQFNIYRIVQEAINNILKHAGATEAGIQLIGKQNNLTIMIEDNGKGFNPQHSKKGRGQKNMRARTQWLNGNFHVDSTPGHGTTICIDIPSIA
ncbi:MAG: tetratricopeptide repeat protein [Flavobacteriales bacterium]